MTKYIFVTGGVVSSVGKGITTASLGRLLTNRGFNVLLLKIDPYINSDAGTMDPFQHGEVFVTNDGAETDLDLGHYERFLGKDLTQASNVTTGQVYATVIEEERDGKYQGQTVQLIPHITDEIKRRIYQLGRECDIVITEIGGTIGDFETPPFVETIRQIGMEQGRDNVLYIHVSLIAYLGPWGESKTKPTQHSVRALLSLGVQPDIVVCRCARALTEEMRRKLSLFCGVPDRAVIEARDTKLIDEIPLIFEKEGLSSLVIERLRLPDHPPQTAEWEEMIRRLREPKDAVNIAITGKYTAHGDAYLSVQEALKHGGIANEVSVKIHWIDSEELAKKSEEEIAATFEEMDGVLVPGGFGYRGIEGMIVAARHAREKLVPYFGLCLGVQCLVIEFARNVAGLEKANSTEFDPDTPHPVIDWLPDQRKVTQLGGTMRLGLYPCVLKQDTCAYESYHQPIILERHRHRYEVNNRYREPLAEQGIIFSGLSPDDQLVEIAEVKGHPWMLGSQFHPEFRSKPLAPHPLFRDFIAAALRHKSEK